MSIIQKYSITQSALNGDVERNRCIKWVLIDWVGKFIGIPVCIGMTSSVERASFLTQAYKFFIIEEFFEN